MLPLRSCAGKIFHSSHAASPYTRKIGLPRGTPTRGGAAGLSASDVAREWRSRGSRRRRLLPAPWGWAAAVSQTPWHMRSGAPRERLRFSSALGMPPERRSRTKAERRAGTMPGKQARPGSGGTPRKAARSSQRAPQAGQRAAPRAVTAAAAAEEESRLRQRNRLVLEDDKPAAERCLEQLVFGDVEDDEDALLRRLRSSRVREARSVSGHTLRAGRAAGGEAPGAEPGGPAAAGAQVGGTGDRGRRGAPRRLRRWAAGWRGRRRRLPPPQRGRGAPQPAVAPTAGLVCEKAACTPESGASRSNTVCWNRMGGRWITCRDSVSWMEPIRGQKA